MPRITRSKSSVSAEPKQNIAAKPSRRSKHQVNKRKSNTTDEDSSPSKSSRSSSLSSDGKENITTKTTRRRNKRKSNTKEDDSSPSSKSSRESLSPFRSQFDAKLSLLSPNDIQFRSARRALVDNSEFQLPGRESEYEELKSFIQNLVDSNGSGSLYISGAPGTGKTATVSKIINSLKLNSKIKIGFINCTAITSATAVYKNICSEMKLKDTSGTAKDCSARIKKHLRSNHKTILLVLDEIDQLCSSGTNQNVLYQIFEWPSIPQSKLILIGIANALDLTDRKLVRLQKICELKPKLMHFTAYTKSQIVDIFKSRLEDNGVLDLFPPAAIQLLAAKVASVSGDIRRALNIGERVVELAKLDSKKNKKALDLTKFEQLITNDDETSKEDKPQEQKRIQLKEVVSVLNSVYGNAQSLVDDIDESFPLGQKILICTLLLLIKYDKNKTITVGRLHFIYTKICKKWNMESIDLSEFLNICILAETRGIMRIVKKKESRFNIVQLVWDEEEVYRALKDKQMITNVLNETGLLGN